MVGVISGVLFNTAMFCVYLWLDGYDFDHIPRNGWAALVFVMWTFLSLVAGAAGAAIAQELRRGGNG